MRTLSDCFGNTVRLTDERLGHILRHPEMQGFESSIESALNGPDQVRQSRSDASVSLFYGFHDKPPWAQNDSVVVKNLEADAFVVTAYLTDKPKAGELLWPTR